MAILRRAGHDLPLVPNVVGSFDALQRITKETGTAWQARVDGILDKARTCHNSAKPEALTAVRAMVLKG